MRSKPPIGAFPRIECAILTDSHRAIPQRRTPGGAKPRGSESRPPPRISRPRAAWSAPSSTGPCSGTGSGWPEYITISAILRGAPAKYARSYLNSEYEADLTYFFIDQLRVIDRAFNDLEAYLESRMNLRRDIRSALSERHRDFNHRQLSLLESAVAEPGTSYTVNSHRSLTMSRSRQHAMTSWRSRPTDCWSGGRPCPRPCMAEQTPTPSPRLEFAWNSLLSVHPPAGIVAASGRRAADLASVSAQ